MKKFLLVFLIVLALASCKLLFPTMMSDIVYNHTWYGMRENDNDSKFGWKINGDGESAYLRLYDVGDNSWSDAMEVKVSTETDEEKNMTIKYAFASDPEEFIYLELIYVSDSAFDLEDDDGIIHFFLDRNKAGISRAFPEL